MMIQLSLDSSLLDYSELPCPWYAGRTLPMKHCRCYSGYGTKSVSDGITALRLVVAFRARSRRKVRSPGSHGGSVGPTGKGSLFKGSAKVPFSLRIW